MACRRNVLATLAAVGAFHACAATEAADNAALCAAYAASRSHVEIVADGTVTRTLGVQQGRVSPHEGFLMRPSSACSVVVRVEVNTDFTGPIPLQRGQHVLVKGEYEYYPLGGVIHWTHRDMRGRHAGGYIATGGRVYN